ncbi:phosphomevalonate kinase [Sulfobacillus harzensis]|uniref:phosphomevalonate kinase n=1 Tax=Sulfobacillus harzensis TaxID=2729629 RepID=A0A7Y0L602_9FIRM|nr:phosphomevalonate kinase [Sulfobacillus harzensis]NMP23683.1 phosphomevalonate kinase [Sulfobacillus harzensis]
MMAVSVRAPGKLMLMGEYAVTELGHPGVVAAVDRYLHCRISSGQSFSAIFGNGDAHAVVVEAPGWSPLLDRIAAKPDLRLAAQALVVLDQYFRALHLDPRPFHLVTFSDLQAPSGTKYGLGSSAALTVGVVSALLKWTLPWSPRKEEIFKLAALAHLAVQPRGSLADVAAGVFGGIIHYERFDPGWVSQYAASQKLTELIERPWPGLVVKPLDTRSAVPWQVGWTGQSASTPALLDRVARFCEAHPDEFARFLARSDTAVGHFVKALVARDGPAIIEAVRKNRHALKELSERAQLGIETPMMRAALNMAEAWGGAGKSSGAGAGDIIVAWMPGTQNARLRQAWNRLGIATLPLRIEPAGVVLNVVEHSD